MAEAAATETKTKRYTPGPEQLAAMAKGREARRQFDLMNKERIKQGLEPLPRPPKEKKVYPRRDRQPKVEERETDRAPPLEGDEDGEPGDDPIGAPVPRAAGVPDYSGRRPQNLTDIMSMYPIGDGSFYVRVDRKKPIHYQGVMVGGVQAKIWNQMTDAEFEELYGGYEFELRVYGPPTKGEPNNPDGSPRYKAYTDPIKFVSSSPPLRVPEPDTEEFEQEEFVNHPPNGRPMSVERRPLRGAPPTSADADMLRTKLGHEAELDDRQYNRQREREERERREKAEKERLELDRLKIEEDRRRYDLERAREEANEKVKLAQEAAAAQAASNRGLDIRDLLQLVKPDKSDELVRVQEQHKEELRRIMADHEERLRMERERFDRNIKDVTERSDRLIKDADDRSLGRVRDAEQRAEQRVRDVETTYQRRIDDVERRREQELAELRESNQRRIEEMERRCTERIGDIDRNNERRIQDMERGHQAEIRSLKLTAEVSSNSSTATHDMQLSQLRSENQRITAENQRLIGELATAKEAAENWLERMEEFQQRAEAMGFTRDEGGGGEGEKDEGWKSIAGDILKTAVTKLPEIAQAAGQAIQSARGAIPAGSPTQQQALARNQMVTRSNHTAPQMHANPMQHFQPLPFASDDGPNFMPQMAPPLMPRPAPQSQPVPHPPTPQQAPPPMMSQPPPPPAPLVEQQPPSQAIMPVQPTQEPAPQFEAPPAQGEPEGDNPFDRLINRVAQGYDSSEPPAQLATWIYQGIVVDAGGSEAAAQAFIQNFKIEMVFEHLAQSQSPAAQKLQRRDGQKYIRDIWAVLTAPR